MPKQLPALPPVRWYASTPSRIRLCAAGAGFAVFVVSLSVERIVTVTSPEAEALFAHAAAGLFTGTLVLLLLREWAIRREAIREHLALVANLNHHIRNALSAIQMSYFVAQDKKSLAIVQHSIDRIDWALRELLGEVESPKKRPARVSAVQTESQSKPSKGG